MGSPWSGNLLRKAGVFFLAEGGRAAWLQSRVFERNFTHLGWFGGSARVFLHVGLRTRQSHRSSARERNGKAMQTVQEEPATEPGPEAPHSADQPSRRSPRRIPHLYRVRQHARVRQPLTRGRFAGISEAPGGTEPGGMLPSSRFSAGEQDLAPWTRLAP